MYFDRYGHKYRAGSVDILYYQKFRAYRLSYEPRYVVIAGDDVTEIEDAVRYNLHRTC